jgi:hypothetical protein
MKKEHLAGGVFLVLLAIIFWLAVGPRSGPKEELAKPDATDERAAPVAGDSPAGETRVPPGEAGVPRGAGPSSREPPRSAGASPRDQVSDAVAKLPMAVDEVLREAKTLPGKIPLPRGAKLPQLKPKELVSATTCWPRGPTWTESNRR